MSLITQETINVIYKIRSNGLIESSILLETLNIKLIQNGKKFIFFLFNVNEDYGLGLGVIDAHHHNLEISYRNVNVISNHVDLKIEITNKSIGVFKDRFDLFINKIFLSNIDCKKFFIYNVFPLCDKYDVCATKALITMNMS